MKAKRKSLFAFICAGILIAVLLIVGYYVWQMNDHATNFQTKKEINSSEDIDWEYWKSINPDVVGWVKVSDTNINYPIVQAPEDDPGYYLTHDIYKSWSVYGVPYLDATCSELGFESPNSMIFGHNMDDGSIFADFAKYNNKSYALDHKNIQIFTPIKTYSIDVLYVDVVKGNAEAKRTSFLDRTDFVSWYKDSRDSADVILDTTSTPTKVMTFVTCSYNQSNDERTMVVGS